MTKDRLMESLESYGYPLVREAAPPERVLKSLLEVDDARLLEGFPVVLVNVFQSRDTMDWERSGCREWHLASRAQKRLAFLTALSYLLFQKENLDQGLQSRALQFLFSLPNGKKVLKRVEKAFMSSETLKSGGDEFSSERFKNVFHSYLPKAGSVLKDQNFEKKKHDLELELLLSEVFTTRQKQLLKKRLQNDPLTKTEREYFSRVLKKRLRALASDELHHMANQILLG